MGVYFDKSRNKFVARVPINGKRTYLGRYDTRAEAEYVVLQKSPSFETTYELFFNPDLIERPSFLSRIKSFFTKGL